MTRWRRLKSAMEWGLFLGIVSWLLATGISNKIPTIGVWGIILSRVLMGFIIGMVRWEFPWWGRGIVIGAALNILLSLIFKIPLGDIVRDIGWGWLHGFWLMLISGIVFGICIELALRHKKRALKQEKASSEELKP